jgi:hypothetical protein
MSINNIKTLVGYCLYFFYFPVGIMAAPQVVVDTADYNAGNIREESQFFIRHVFTIKNAGDEPLKIVSIKPSCGCTTYDNDSLIKPGCFGHISMRVDLSEIKEVNFSKYISVRTNDLMWPRVKLTITGTITSLIHFEPESIVLPTMGNNDTVQEITLVTGKHDLLITEVAFELDNPPVEWLSRVQLRYVFDKNCKKDSAGLYVYKLKVFYNPVQKGLSGYGKFVLKTNHPDKHEVKISGTLDVK